MLLLFDLDGTLLKTDKTISYKTIEAIDRCKETGHLIGISTARSEINSDGEWYKFSKAQATKEMALQWEMQ